MQEIGAKSNENIAGMLKAGTQGNKVIARMNTSD